MDQWMISCTVLLYNVHLQLASRHIEQCNIGCRGGGGWEGGRDSAIKRLLKVATSAPLNQFAATLHKAETRSPSAIPSTLKTQN